MPRLNFHAISEGQVKGIAKSLTDELAILIGCAREHFVLECVASTYVWDGQVVLGHPYVEVHCFDRGIEVFDRMVEIITRHLSHAGCPSVDVAFRLLERRFYYEDGAHL
ncbi:MAG: DUF1904 family protein [Peptococcaceae bacterium]|nr:DUF1904 family protein [Peptococcaceae bacterium]